MVVVMDNSRMDKEESEATLLGLEASSALLPLDIDDVEAQAEKSQGLLQPRNLKLAWWIVLNVLATIGIVGQLTQSLLI